MNHPTGKITHSAEGFSVPAARHEIYCNSFPSAYRRFSRESRLLERRSHQGTHGRRSADDRHAVEPVRAIVALLPPGPAPMLNDTA